MRDSVKLNVIPQGCYFFLHGKKYLKTAVTKDLGKTILCHPVIQGQFGEVVLDGSQMQWRGEGVGYREGQSVNTWLPQWEQVDLAHVGEEDE